MNSHDAMQWAFRQAEFLTPSAHHLLLFLAGNAFYSDDNKEGMPKGVVLSARSSQLAMVRFTSMSRRTVQRSLEELDLCGYIMLRTRRGPLTNTIAVLWGQKYEEQRAEGRARTRPKTQPVKPSKVAVTAPVVSLSDWKGRNSMRHHDANHVSP